MAKNDPLHDNELRTQRGTLDDNHSANIRMYRDMLADSDAAYDLLKAQARIDRALSELAGGPARASSTLKARDESAMRNELGDTERQRERFSYNVDHALASLTRKKDADEVIAENLTTARQTAMEINQRKFDAELGLQQKYHEMNKKNSLFDQMYKLYTKRLIGKDTFKAMTGIEVKAMPRPHRTVVKKSANVIQVSKDWKGTPPKGYKMRGSYDKNTKEWSFYMVKDEYLKTLEDNDVSLYDNNHIIKQPGQLYAELNIDGFKGADPATQLTLLQNKDNRDDFVNEFGEGAYWAQQYGSVWEMYSPFSGIKGLDAVDQLIEFADNAQEYIDKQGEKQFYQDFSGLLDAAFVNLKEAISYDEQGGISLDLVRSIPAAKDIELYYDENSLQDQIHLAKGEAPERMNYPALLGSLRMPSYYEMPAEITNETLIKVLQDWWGFNKPDSWMAKDQMELEEPTQAGLKDKGTTYAKTEAEKADDTEIGLITDEYAAWLGSCVYQDELLEKNGVKADAATDYEADNEKIYYKWNPVDWVNDSRIYDEDKLTTGKKEVPIIGGADDIVTYANAAIENILYKKYWQEVADDDYAILEAFGMTDIIEYLKGLDTVAYKELPTNARDAVKRDILKQGNGAYQDFTDEQLDYLKTATVSDMDERIAGEAAIDEPDKQMLDALRLYRYYKNDLGITVTGDYEADRTAAKRLFVGRMCELTQSNSLEEVILKMHDMFDGMDEAGYETHYPDELLEAKALWSEAPPELFANTKEETEAAYQSQDAAFVAGVRDSFSLGASQLQKETEADPAVLKHMALQGHQVGGTELYRQGRFYNPGITEESAMMRQNNPDDYTFGSIAGGIPTMVATGNFFGGAAKALGVTGRTTLNAISGAAPMAVQAGLQSVAEGDNVGETIVKIFFWGGTGALSFGTAANKVNAALGTLLKKAPALVQKVVPSLGGASTTAITNAGVNLVAGALSGQEVDINQALAGMAVDAVFALFLNGRSGDTYLDPQTGKKIAIPEGKTLRSVDPEAARFYEALGDTKVTGELHKAIGDIYTQYMDIPESMVIRSDFAPLEISYRVYEVNPTVAHAAAFIDEAVKVQRIASGNRYSMDSPYSRIDKAMEADTAAGQGAQTDIGTRATDIGATASDVGANTTDIGKNATDFGATAKAYVDSRSGMGDNIDIHNAVERLEKFAVENDVGKLSLSSEAILNLSGGNIDLAERLMLATKEVLPGRPISKLAQMYDLPSNPDVASLTIYEARIWYLWQESQFNSRLDYSKPLEQVAYDAFNMRNETRTKARDVMMDRAWADHLMKNEKNKAFEDRIEYYSTKGFQGDALWMEIIGASMRSRDKVNDLFGL